MGLLPEVHPVGSYPWAHQGPHLRSAAAMLENVGIDLARPGTGDNVRQPNLLLSFLLAYRLKHKTVSDVYLQLAPLIHNLQA